MLLIKLGTTNKKWVEELKIKASDSKKYEVEAIWDSVVYRRKIKDHLPELHYLILWKNYFKEENT